MCINIHVQKAVWWYAYLKISSKLASRIYELSKRESVVFIFNQVYNTKHEFLLVEQASHYILRVLG